MKVNLAEPVAVATAAAMVLRTHPFATIATIGVDAKPWAVPVHQVTLDDGNFSWRSARASRHSHNIEHSSLTSAVLYSATKDHGEISLFLEGSTAPISDIDRLQQVLNTRYGSNPPPHSTIQDLSGDSPYLMYEFTPTAAWLNDDSHQKTRVDLNLLKQSLALNA